MHTITLRHLSDDDLDTLRLLALKLGWEATAAAVGPERAEQAQTALASLFLALSEHKVSAAKAA